MWSKVISSKQGVKLRTCSRYGMRFGCFVSHSPLVWLITKAESPYTCKNLTLKSIAALIPMMHASYSAMLLVQLKHNLAVKGVCPPVGDVMMRQCHCQVRLRLHQRPWSI